MATRVTRAPLPAGFSALWATVAVDLVGFGIVIPILPLYAERFDASPATIGALLASFSLAQLVAAPLWGRASDRVGRKPALVVSLIGTALGSLLTALAPNLLLVFLGRIVDGASGGSVAVAQAAAADLAPPDARPRLLGLLGAAYGVGFVAGPAIGGMASLAGPRAPFVLAAALAAANALLAARRLCETRPAAEPAPAAAGRTPRTPLVPAVFLMTAAFSAFEATFALLASRRLDLGPAAVSIAFVVAGLFIAGTNARAVGPSVRRWGELGALRLGLAVEGAGLLLLAVAGTLPVLAVAVLLLAVGHGIAVPAATAAVSARVAPHRRGAALGSQQAAASLARVVGPLAAGAAFGLQGPTLALAGAGSLSLAAVVATRGLGRAGPARARPGAAADVAGLTPAPALNR